LDAGIGVCFEKGGLVFAAWGAGKGFLRTGYFFFCTAGGFKLNPLLTAAFWLYKIGYFFAPHLAQMLKHHYPTGG